MSIKRFLTDLGHPQGASFSSGHPRVSYFVSASGTLQVLVPLPGAATELTDTGLGLGSFAGNDCLY